MEKEIIERLKDIYFFMQYGKLMPGMIHNINGKITVLDSKIILSAMKIQMKIKKLQAKKEEMSEDEFNSKITEHEDMLKIIEQFKAPMLELNHFMKNLNDKIFNENSQGIQMIDINGTIKSFGEYFKIYKRFKHDSVVEYELEGNPFIKMEYKDIYNILYVVTRNAVDSTINSGKENKIVFKTENHNDFVVLSISANGANILDESKLFEPLYTTKKGFLDSEQDDNIPNGEGLDLYFLKLSLEKYAGYDYSLKNVEDGTEFKIKLLKK
ncbi:MAG: hypothetical protein KKD38_08090 [Candidatus Delongbacteria bacterium]|nr:hypothetical protein [Candidatus Delongbacteria bacterium]MCG2760022.1 hypothetical protein [Candidatus Delongbacteria bacterium]